MPPKRKAAEKGEEHLERETFDPELEITSPLSSASSCATRSSCSSLSAEQLQQILVANQKAMLEASHSSMAALLATFSPTVASTTSTPRVPQVKVPKWSDEEIPFEYFSKLEKALKHNGVDSSSWGQLLPVYLTGRAQAALAQVDLDSLTDYESIKMVLLDSLGDTPASADRKWWSLDRLSGEEPSQFYLRVRSIGLRKLHGLKTREDFVEHVVLTRFLSLLSPDCYSFVIARQPKSGLEAAKLLQEFEESRNFPRRRQPWKDSHQYRREPSIGYGHNGGSVGGPSVVDNVPCSKDGIDTGSGQNSDRSSYLANEIPVGRNFNVRRQVTCHGCGEVGHIKPNCPLRVRSVRSVRSVAVPNAASGQLVDGLLAGVLVKGLKIDSGAEITVVHKDFIPRGAYTGSSVLLDSWRKGQFSRHRVARIAIQFGEVKEVAEVAVSDSMRYPALLGSDLSRPMLKELFLRVLDQIDDVSAELKVGEQVALEEVRDMVDEIARAKADFVPETLAAVFDPPDSYVERDSVATLVEELNEWPDWHDLDELAEVVVVPLAAKEPVPLTDVFCFSDDYFEPDPVSSPVIVLSTGPDLEGSDLPLPAVGVEGSVCLSEEQEQDVSLNEGVVFLDRKKKESDEILDEHIVFLMVPTDVSQDGRNLDVGVALESVADGSLIGMDAESVGRVKVKMKVKVVLYFFYDRRFLPKFVANSYHLTEATGQTPPGRVLSGAVLLNLFLYYLYAYALSKFFEAEAAVSIFFAVEYRPGSSNVNADVLSWILVDSDFSLPVSPTTLVGGNVMKSPHLKDLGLPNMGRLQTASPDSVNH